MEQSKLPRHIVEQYSQTKYAVSSVYGVRVDDLSREDLLIVVRALANTNKQERAGYSIALSAIGAKR